MYYNIYDVNLAVMTQVRGQKIKFVQATYLTKHGEWNFFLHVEQHCRGVWKLVPCKIEKHI